MTDEQLLTELQQDPGGIGYADAGAADGFKPTKDLCQLLGGSHGTVPNPEEPPLVYPALSLENFFSLLDDAVIAGFSDTAIGELTDAVRNGDRELVAAWGRIGFARGKITEQQRDAVLTALAQQIPDPSHPTTVPATPRLQELGEQGITPAQIDRVLGRAQ